MTDNRKILYIGDDDIFFKDLKVFYDKKCSRDTVVAEQIIINDNPSVLSYLSMGKAEGKFLNSGQKITIIPDLKHMEALQFAQFTSARIRWHFDSLKVNKQEFLNAYKNDSLEELFTNGSVSDIYIEGRDPGANFPDTHLNSLGNELSWSTIMAPSAIQSGIINNLDEALQYLRTFKWQHLNLLREAAIKDGLHGEVGGVKVFEFTKKVLEISAKGLPVGQQKLLAYPVHVLQTKQNGADRALVDYSKGKSIKDIVKSRNVSV